MKKFHASNEFKAMFEKPDYRVRDDFQDQVVSKYEKKISREMDEAWREIKRQAEEWTRKTGVKINPMSAWETMIDGLVG